MSSLMLCLELTHRKQAQQDLEMLAEYANSGGNTDYTTSTDIPHVGTDEDIEKPDTVSKRNISGLTNQNPDCIGWIYIPDTSVDYPVMFTPQIPEKYLRKNFDGAYSVAGIPFLDHRCNFDCNNLIIYGHNMSNGTMFADLIKYLDEDFRQDHLSIEFETVEGCIYYTVTDVRLIDKWDEWYNTLYSDDGKDYLTLSTCYGESDDDRLIVIAVKDSSATMQ